jgi:hypothetical protein
VRELSEVAVTWYHPHDPDAPEDPEEDGLEEDFDPPEDSEDPSHMPLTEFEKRYNK